MSLKARILLPTVGALVVLGAGAAGWLLTHRAGAGLTEYVISRVGDARLIYLPTYARFADGRAGGNLAALELAATFPGFQAAGESAQPLDQADSKATLVFFTISRSDRKVDPADLVAMLYARFLEAEVVETDSGLLERMFQDGSPYSGEDLYFAPPEGRAFAARCPRPTVPPDGLPETCMASFRDGPVDVDIRFPKRLLAQWEKLNEGARALVASLIAR